jgi:DNA-binding MarR family transcriptional regulator
MKDFISQLNKSFESRIRLGIMSVLMVNESIDFLSLKEMLEASDGNIASHVAALEKAEYLTIEKKFVGKKTSTTYTITTLGREAFNQHLNALEQLLKR